MELEKIAREEQNEEFGSASEAEDGACYSNDYYFESQSDQVIKTKNANLGFCSNSGAKESQVSSGQKPLQAMKTRNSRKEKEKCEYTIDELMEEDCEEEFSEVKPSKKRGQTKWQQRLHDNHVMAQENKEKQIKIQQQYQDPINEIRQNKRLAKERYKAQAIVVGNFHTGHDPLKVRSFRVKKGAHDREVLYDGTKCTVEWHTHKNPNGERIKI